MRSAEEIREDGRRKEDLIIELLLDIRQLLSPKPKIQDFACDECDKSFSHAIALAGHKRSHK
jgi:hypothetical protein